MSELQETLTILVVEDDPGDFGLIQVQARLARLDRGGEGLTWAKTLADGIAAARRTTPDVVLLDLALPDSSGLATVQAMRNALPDVPIIVLTGHDSDTLTAAALETGAQDYLVKGQFDHDALGRAVRHAVVRGKLEQRLVHHQQHLEEMVNARTIELMRALVAAEAASRAKSVFLANISHEIRTPLSGIIGMTSVVTHFTTDSKQLDRLAKIDAAAHHLLEILNNVLEIAKIEAGKVVIDEGEFDPVEMLREVRSLLEGQANAKGLSIELECDPALPSHMLGDAMKLKQVLMNLAGNGVKFTEHGIIKLSAQIKNRDAAGMQVRFAVGDTGIGIEARNMERIFLAFEQADNSNTRAHGGTGLGLAISRSLVNLMGGNIDIHSIPGQGSTFSFAVWLKVPSPMDTTGK